MFKTLPNNTKIRVSPNTLQQKYEVDVVLCYYAKIKSHWLMTAIDSILNQLDCKVLLHCISNEDQERIKEITKTFGIRNNLRHYYSPKNRGPYVAVNRIWDKLETDYYAVQDSDDYSVPNRLRDSLDELAQGYDVYGAGVFNFEDYNSLELKKKRKELPLVNSENQWSCFHYPTIVHGTTVLKRQVFEEMGGYNCTLTAGSDNHLSQRIRQRGYKVYNGTEIVSYRRLVNNSYSHTLQKDKEDNRKTIEITLDHLRQIEEGADPKKFGDLDKWRTRPLTQVFPGT